MQMKMPTATAQNINYSYYHAWPELWPEWQWHGKSMIMTERRLTPPTEWARQADAPNSLQSAQQASVGGRKRYAETKQRTATADRNGNGHGHDSRSNSRLARMRPPPPRSAPPNDRSTNKAQAAKKWVSKLMPSSPGKRKRPFDHPLGLPTLASPGTTHPSSNSRSKPQHQHQQQKPPPPPRQQQQQQQRHPPPPKVNTNTTTRRSETNNPSVDSSSNDSGSHFLTAQKTALHCVDHASRRQAAAKAALTATAQISSSLNDLVGDSKRAVSVARQSRIEAENATLRAEEAAKKVREANELAVKDKQRASLELDEANAQTEEAKEFLRRVKRTPKGRNRGADQLKPKRETALPARIGTVVEVRQDSSDTNSSSIANSTLSPRRKAVNPLSRAEPKKQRSEPISGGQLPWQKPSNLPQPQIKMSSQPATSSRQDALIEPMKKFKGHTSPITQIATLDESNFISSSWDTTIRMWNADTGECVRTFRGHKDWVHAICVLDSKHFISGSDDRTIKMWNVDKGECVRTFTGHSSFVKALAPMDGDRFLSGSRDRTIKLFSSASEECLQTFEGHVDVVSAIVALDSSHFATGSHDHTIKYWEDSSRTCVRTLVGHSGSIKTLAAVSDKEIVSGSDDKMIRLWDVTTGKCLREFGTKNSLVFSVTYICEGFFLSCGGNNIKLYHIPSGTCVKSYETPRISLAVVRLDDERFITGSDQMLHLWKF